MVVVQSVESATQCVRVCGRASEMFREAWSSVCKVILWQVCGNLWNARLRGTVMNKLSGGENMTHWSGCIACFNSLKFPRQFKCGFADQQSRQVISRLFVWDGVCCIQVLSALYCSCVFGIISWFEWKPLSCLACLNSSKVDVRETGFSSSKVALLENGQGSCMQEDDQDIIEEKRCLGTNIVDAEHIGCKSLRQKYQPCLLYF